MDSARRIAIAVLKRDDIGIYGAGVVSWAESQLLPIFVNDEPTKSKLHGLLIQARVREENDNARRMAHVRRKTELTALMS